MDSPIAMHCSTNETSKGTGDVSLGDLFDEVSSDNYILSYIHATTLAIARLNCVIS